MLVQSIPQVLGNLIWLEGIYSYNQYNFNCFTGNSIFYCTLFVFAAENFAAYLNITAPNHSHMVSIQGDQSVAGPENAMTGYNSVEDMVDPDEFLQVSQLPELVSNSSQYHYFHETSQVIPYIRVQLNVSGNIIQMMQTYNEHMTEPSKSPVTNVYGLISLRFKKFSEIEVIIPHFMLKLGITSLVTA